MCVYVCGKIHIDSVHMGHRVGKIVVVHINKVRSGIFNVKLIKENAANREERERENECLSRKFELFIDEVFRGK